MAYYGGGSFYITRTRNGVETKIWPPDEIPLWTSSYGNEFHGVAKGIELLSGDEIRCYVEHNDASVVDLVWAEMSLELVDHIVQKQALDYRQTVLEDGPVAYWRLGEAEVVSTAADETGNGHDGTYDAGVTQGVTGLLTDDPNLAAHFNGTSDAVDIPIAAELKFLDADYTLELWCQIPGSVTGDITLFGWTNGPRWSIGYSTAAGKISFLGERGGSSLVATDGGYDFGTTYHVVVTYNATSNVGTIYINGAQINTDTDATSITDGVTPIRIGRDTATGEPATIDEVAVYDYVFEPSQVLKHYRVGTGGLF